MNLFKIGKEAAVIAGKKAGLAKVVELLSLEAQTLGKNAGGEAGNFYFLITFDILANLMLWSEESE